MTRTQTLWAIGNELEALKALMDECNPELEPEVNATLDAWFREVAANEATKLDCYAGLMRQLEAEESALTAEAEQFAAKAKARKNERERLRARALEYIQRSGRTKVTTASGRVFAVQQNGGKAPLRLVDNIDPSTVPDHLVQVKRILDMEAIRTALEAADPDAKRIAMLDARGCHLRVK